MKKKLNFLIPLSIVFGSATIVFLCLFLSYYVQADNYKKQLENTYMKSFYEMVSNVNDIEVDLSKIIATTSIDGQRELLTGLGESCSLLVNNINNLPITYNKLTENNKLFNTMGGFMKSLLVSNYAGNLISDNDYKQINSLHDRVLEMQYDLNVYQSKLLYDYNILDDVNISSVDDSNFSAGLINTESSNSKVPSLIYDGPFSDSVLNREIKGLKDIDYSMEEIKDKLSEIFSDAEIKYVGDTSGKFATYNFVVSSDIELNVSVTKKGGFLLTITGFGTGQSNKITIQDGLSIAENLASDLGINNMYTVWHQNSGNILYVNLAPIVNHVIYYSDLIKVKVDLSYGRVVGWEATNYVTNHISRSFTSAIGILDAENTLNDILTIKERNLCIIPDKYVGELSAYEFICTWKNYTYYIYVDSNTGQEVNVLRVIDTSNGQLLI